MSKIEWLLEEADKEMKNNTPEENEFFKKLGSNTATAMIDRAINTMNDMIELDSAIVLASFAETFMAKLYSLSSENEQNNELFTKMVAALTEELN